LSLPAPLLDPTDPREEVAAALREWLHLQRLLALRPQDAVAALAKAPDPTAALRRCGERTPPDTAWLDAAVATLSRQQAVALPWTSPLYPERARQLSDAAPLLLVRGDPGLLQRPAVAIVGARAATGYGRVVAEQFAGELAAAGLVVVSGLALGIDSVAHGAALAVGGTTLAVQACGPDIIYPGRHHGLARRILEQGALVTEFPPGTRPRPGFFPLRNRLISALAATLLVVEARERSGSLVTATHAADQGLEVWAVPGPLSSPTSAGTNRLIFDGADIALSPQLILESLQRKGVLPPPPPPNRADRAGSLLPAAKKPSALVSALLHQPMTRDELAQRLELAPENLAVELLELELAGAVIEDRDGRLRVVSPQKVPGL